MDTFISPKHLSEWVGEPHGKDVWLTKFSWSHLKPEWCKENLSFSRPEQQKQLIQKGEHNLMSAGRHREHLDSAIHKLDEVFCLIAQLEILLDTPTALQWLKSQIEAINRTDQGCALGYRWSCRYLMREPMSLVAVYLAGVPQAMQDRKVCRNHRALRGRFDWYDTGRTGDAQLDVVVIERERERAEYNAIIAGHLASEPALPIVFCPPFPRGGKAPEGQRGCCPQPYRLELHIQRLEQVLAVHPVHGFTNLLVNHQRLCCNLPAYPRRAWPPGLRRPSCYLGIPDAVAWRVAPLTEAASEPDTNELALRVMPPQVTSAAVVNRPDFRRASIPGGGGIMNARAIARHYAMLAQEGVLDGVRFLSAEQCSLIRALQTDAPDARSGARRRRGLGYALGGEPEHGGDSAMGHGGREFGHAGNGGSLGFADPVRKLSFGLTKNRMRWPEPTEEPAYLVAETIRAYLEETTA